MQATVEKIIKAMEVIAPIRLAETWDNPGLQVGNSTWSVKKILISLDPTPHVINYAAEESVDMLITHHPLLFQPLKAVDLSTPIGGIIGTAIQNSIAVYAAHTNLDSVSDGLNDMLAGRLELKEVAALSPHVNDAPDSPAERQKTGLGRIGNLPVSTDLISLCRTLKHVLDLDNVRLVGDETRRVERIALCTGSGSSLLDRFYSSGADVFITGDVRYHDARDAENQGAALIDIGHFGSEHIMVGHLARRLIKILAKMFPDVEVLTYEGEKDPFVAV